MKILVPSLIAFVLEPKLEGDVTVVNYDAGKPIPAVHRDADALVVWGMSEALLRDAAIHLDQVRWVQLLSAGSDAALAAGFSPSVVITSGRSLHDAPVAEHALALLLAAARRLDVLMRAQVGSRWAGELGGIQPEPSPGRFSTLRGAHVAIWGFGSIGSALAPLLTALGAQVTGVATQRREQDGYSVVTADALPELLPGVDVLVMILPASPTTDKALDRALLAALPAHAWVVNVGRGSTVDEEALIEVLRNNELGGAALDVTSVEPLPASSRLWELTNVIITPHAAGGRPLGAQHLITQNIESYLAGAPMQNLTTSHGRPTL